MTSSPLYGKLVGEFPNLRYQHYGNHLRPDSFAYRTSEGSLQSGDLIVNLEVRQLLTIDGPTGGSTGAPIELTSALEESGEAHNLTYNWTLSRKGQILDSGDEDGFSFTPQDPGVYEVRLEIRDEAGGIRRDHRVITVTTVNPTVQFKAGPSDGSSLGLISALLEPVLTGDLY